MHSNPLIYFTETTASERRFFERELADLPLRFVAGLDEVGDDAEVLSLYIHDVVTDAVLDARPRLRLIVTRSTGYDHIDLEACGRRGVLVANIRGVDETAVAEHTFALLLAISRRLFDARESHRRGAFDYESLRSFNLSGKTLGVLGAGRSGRHVIRLARAFRMRVLVHDPREHRFFAARVGARYATRDEVLREADIVTLHMPLTRATRHMINRRTLAQCRPGVIIINTARGGLIDTEALIEALESGLVEAVGLDVLEDESLLRREATQLVGEQIVERIRQGAIPAAADGRVRELQSLFAHRALLARPNVVFTPHVAFNSAETVARIALVTVKAIRSFLDGRPSNLVSHEEDMLASLEDEVA